MGILTSRPAAVPVAVKVEEKKVEKPLTASTTPASTPKPAKVEEKKEEKLTRGWFEVETIVDARVSGRKTEYFIKWKGFDSYVSLFLS